MRAVLVMNLPGKIAYKPHLCNKFSGHQAYKYMEAALFRERPLMY